MNSVIPVFRIFDESKMREFYLEYLGFKVLFKHRFEDNMPLYMGVEYAHCQLHLCEHHGEATPGSAARFEIEAIADYQRLLTAKKHRYYRPSIDVQPWGLDMTLLDPSVTGLSLPSHIRGRSGIALELHLFPLVLPAGPNDRHP